MFSCYKSLSGAISIVKVLNQKVGRQPNLLSSSSKYINLSQWFLHKATAFTLSSVATTNHFFTTLKSTTLSDHSLKHYGFFGMPFSILCKYTKTVTDFWIGPTSASSL